jgi:predicted GH43/DUF377 family glycosyl hydrolase
LPDFQNWRRAVNRMNPQNKQERYFCVSCNHRSYMVTGNENTTLETVWASQKCWFMPGTTVTVTDDKGNSSTFRR